MLPINHDHDTLYEALVSRDERFDGRVFVAVSTTGIFCRLTCPARNPKKENCTFYETVGECIEAGYRACKRCKPLNTLAEAGEPLQRLLAALEKSPNRRWREDDIIAMGYDPSTVRRLFKRNFGITFLEMARLTRLREGFTTLGEGGRVIDAQLSAEFSSPSAFRNAFAKILGLPPSALKTDTDTPLRADWFDTEMGAMIAVSDQSRLHLLEFSDRKALPTELRKLHKLVKGNISIGRYAPTDKIQSELESFLSGASPRFSVDVALHGTPFTQKVWRALMDIPPGETLSYGTLAKTIGHVSSTRAVARANGANQLAIIVPCHRVIGADGSLTGYGGGLWRKRKLIELEKAYQRDRRAG